MTGEGGAVKGTGRMTNKAGRLNPPLQSTTNTTSPNIAAPPLLGAEQPQSKQLYQQRKLQVSFRTIPQDTQTKEITLNLQPFRGYEEGK